MKRAWIAGATATRIVSVLLALLASSGLVVLADYEVLLENGQVVFGIDVRREEGRYRIELATGGAIAIPYELVAEVRVTAGTAPGVRGARAEQLGGYAVDLEDDERPASGLRGGRPQVLEGEDVRPPRTRQQLAALGGPARFFGEIFDPSWRPASDWSEKTDVTEFNPARWFRGWADPEWTPCSDYTRRSDVTEFRPSRWPRPAIDPRWDPEDAFRKGAVSRTRAASRARSGRASGPAEIGTTAPIPTSLTCASCPRLARDPTLAPSPPEPSAPPSAFTTARVRECAEGILAPLIATRSSSAASLAERLEEIRVTLVTSEAFRRLPIPLFEATWEEDDSAHHALFTGADGECRLIGGDLSSLLGIELTQSEAVHFASTAYNRALAAVPPDTVQLDSDGEKIAYALAVSSLVVPGSNDVRLLSHGDELEMREESRCTASRRTRRRNTRNVSDRLAEPRVEPGAGVDVVTFHSWNPVGGAVWRHRALLSHGGAITMQCEPLATHLGDHRCATEE